MSEANLQADMRDGRGKGFNNGLRREGLLPAVIYGKGINGIAIQLNAKEVERILSSETGKNTIININLKASKKKSKVMIRDIQRDPIRGDINHIDFYHISLKEKIQTSAPIHLVGDSKGINKGGIQQQGLRELEIECMPTEIPEHIEVDISGLDIGEHLTVAEINLPEGVQTATEPSTVIVSILAPRLVDEAIEEKEEVKIVEVEKAKEEKVLVHA